MSFSYLARLNSVLESALAAKRTPEQEAEDRRLLKEKMEKKKEKDEKRREEKGQKPQQYRKEAKPKSSKPSSNVKDVVSKLQGMATPCLLLINTNVTSTDQDDNEQVKAEGKANYKKFLGDSDIKPILEACVNITAVEGVQCWLCPDSKKGDLTAAAMRYGVDHSVSDLPHDLLEIESPFEAVKIKLKGMEKTGKSKIKLGINKAWEAIYSSLPKKEEPTEKEKEEQKDEEVDEPSDKNDDAQLDDLLNKDEADEEETPEEDQEIDVDVEDAPKINVGKFRSLKDPHIFILDPRKKRLDYLAFLGPDEEGSKQTKASKVLPKAIKFYVAKHPKLKAPEGEPLIVYFLNAKEAADIKIELKRESPPHFILASFDKELFDKDEPFEDLKLGDAAMEPTLVNELNKLWLDATAQGSGNPVPAVQAGTMVPLDYFRLLNKKQRPVKMYIGNQPEGSGSEDTIYVLASEHEAEAFIKLVRAFKMPSLFYERMSANSDIDAGFKNIDPEELIPANVLILKAVDKFSPKEPVQVTEDNIELLSPQAASEAKKIQEQIEKLKKEDTPQAEVKIKKLTDELQKHVNQLELLHSFARLKLGNRTQKAGSFVKSVTIGTHIAQFNADMTICFLWGALTKHVTVDPKEVIKQLPFVRQVITGYL